MVGRAGVSMRHLTLDYLASHMAREYFENDRKEIIGDELPEEAIVISGPAERKETITLKEGVLEPLEYQTKDPDVEDAAIDEKKRLRAERKQKEKERKQKERDASARATQKPQRFGRKAKPVRLVQSEPTPVRDGAGLQIRHDPPSDTEQSQDPLDQLFASLGVELETDEGTPARVGEIASVADKTLRATFAYVYAFTDENILWLNGDEYRAMYREMPATEVESFDNMLAGNMGADITSKKAPETSFINYSFPEPTLALSAESYQYLEDEDPEVKNWLEVKLASDLVANGIAASPEFRSYHREKTLMQVLQNGLGEKSRILNAKYPDLSPDKLKVSEEVIGTFIEADQAGEILAKGATLYFKMKFPGAGGVEKDEVVPVVGQALDDSIVRYLTHGIVAKMTPELAEHYPKNERGEVRKRYLDHLDELEAENGEFERTAEFLKRLGLEGYGNIIAAYQNGEIPGLYLEAKLKDPELEYAI
jgi:hypothetical protein